MKFLILTICFSLFLFSCKKDSTTSATKTDLITKAAWKFQDAGADMDKNGTIDFSISSQLQDCEKDNTLMLHTDGTGILDEGATKCDPSDPQSSNVNWSFSNNESFLNFTGAGILGISGQFKILSLTETALSFSKDTTLNGTAISLLIQLKH
ncbi:MAG TPA: hypothetical protein VJ499_02770 [Flavisolibacter sp.]|nr:hypothetical protein [Flavisolibacter sp.]